MLLPASPEAVAARPPQPEALYQVANSGRAATAANQELLRITRDLQAKLTELYKGAEFPGATVGFVLADGRAGAVSIGLADVESNIPLKPADRMPAGSIGKTYVAAVLLQLVEEGKVRLDDKVDRWFGGEAWFNRLPNARDLTIRMLMTHTSGIPEHVLNKDLMASLKAVPDRVWKPEELLAFILDAKPLFPSGQGWSYADTNYILVGMVIERVTKKTLYGEVEKRILQPLRLRQTIPSDRRVLPNVITGYSRPNSPFGFEGRTITGGKFIFNPQMEWAGGGFASTPEDLARWAKALYEGKVLKKSSLDQMLTGVDAKTGRGDRYGLGVQIKQSDWGTTYGHGGWFPGYLSEMAYFPKYKTAIAIQFNTDAGRKLKKGLPAYIAEAARIIFGPPATEPAK